MKWEKVKLKDCCIKIGSGATPKGGATVYLDSGITFIRSQNVYNLHFDYDGITYITDDAAEKLNGVTIYENDILLNITGDSVARTCMVPKEVLPARVNQHVAIVRVNQDLMDSKFLSYYLASPQMQAHMLNLAVGKGASRNAITKIMIENFEVPCPPIETQRQIADILSAYDDLIENNQKQIKLLEEAAQRLYKEWFVDLRFPGYEQTKIIDGVPEGWEKVCLKAYCDIKSGYAFKSKDWNKSGCGVIKIKDISNKFVDYSDCDFVPKDIAEKAANYYLNQGDLVIAMTGATIGKIGICTKEGYYANQRVGKVFLGNKPKEKLPYAYCILSQKSTMDFILNNSSASSAQPNISGDKICDIKIVYNEVYVMRFNKKMKSVFEKMILLKEQNEMLSVIRDNLLPKLMSGEIEV